MHEEYIKSYLKHFINLILCC